ncbi:MAG: alpha-amylase family glycosyl hydrolase [Marinoscillum sp.]
MPRLVFYLISTIMMYGCGDDLKTPPQNDGIDKEQTVTPLESVPPLEEQVVYEVNIRAFSAEGTFSGVVQRLPEIKNLGVNVIWLMPIHPIGQLNGIGSPYAVQDYGAVAEEYGSLDELKALINAAHELEIAVIIDWVANHTAWDHDWITAHPEWYTQDGNGNIVEPAGTGWTDVADLNFDSEQLRQEMINEMIYWVDEVGIDGFRADAIDFIPTDFWAQAITDVNAITSRNLIWLGEGGKADNFAAGFEMNYAWDFYYLGLKRVFDEDYSAATLLSIHNNEYNQLPDGTEKLRYITNHDVAAWEESVVDVFDLWGSVSAFVITAFMDGVPLIYTGQEVGYPTTLPFFTKEPINWSQNPAVYDAYAAIMSARANLPAVHYGSLTNYSSTDIVAFTRTYNDQEVLVLANVRNTSKTIALSEEITSTGWTNAISEATLSIEETVQLGAYEFLILRR